MLGPCEVYHKVCLSYTCSMKVIVHKLMLYILIYFSEFLHLGNITDTKSEDFILYKQDSRFVN